MIWQSKHFMRSELECKHCGKMEYTEKGLQALDELREAYGWPMIVLSGYRCPVHNDAVSSTGTTGPHTVTANDNVAVDIRVFGSAALLLVRYAIGQGWTGIGVRQNGPQHARFIHLDRIKPGGKHPRPWIWTY